MTTPIDGRFGALICIAWITSAPTGQDAACLLLAGPGERAPETMPSIAEILGLPALPGGFTPQVTRSRIWIGNDDWVFLQGSGQLVACRPASAEWVALARSDGRVALTVGFEPMPAGTDVEAYTDRLLASGRMTVGLVPLESG